MFSENTRDPVKDGYLKRKGFDAHKIKEDIVGKKMDLNTTVT